MSVRAFVVLVGKAGSGKTTELKRHAAVCRRALIVDVEQEWQLQPGDELVEGHAALFARLRELGAVDPAVPFRLVYHDTVERMQHAAPAAAFATRNLTLIVDELAWLCTAHYLPEFFRRLIQMGRKRRINVLGTTREPQEIHDLFFSQATLKYFFRVEPGNGLDRIRKRYPQLAEALPTLDVHEHRIDGDLSTVELFGREGESLDFSVPPPQVRRRNKKTPRS